MQLLTFKSLIFRETEEAEKATMKFTDAESEVTSDGIPGGSGMPDGLQELCNEFTEIYKAMVSHGFTLI